ncbi:MAG: RsmB/NOP family class I SAM-dependent RNA methyltransferase [Lachnospiraceae bacterium]|nr:RsmB/NOP family class I SAM-dependent RNA methyltransferase [Lachnospiraceae bacterium]
MEETEKRAPLPEAFLHRMRLELEEGGYEAFLKALEQEEIKSLRINPVKMDRVSFMPKEWQLQRVPWEANGYYYRTDGDPEALPGRHPFHAAGAYYIQEPSAMAPVTALDPLPGERVLDLCAAPGGKSTQIAAHMGNDGILFANEVHPSRARILSQNMERMGVRNGLVINMDVKALSFRFPGYFDRILVDAPCSGEGMFRRGDTARREWSPENVAMCAARQAEILDEAAVMLKEGGILCYSTCTFSNKEDEEAVWDFLGRHDHFKLIRMEKLMPHKIRGEGQFYALLKRDGERSRPVRAVSAERKKHRKAPEWERLFEGFAGDFLQEVPWLERERIFLFGESLYLAPEGMPSLEGLKVLRPGLQLGTIKKGRFEPAHALALALKAGEARRSVELSSKGDEIQRYLRGETIPAPENCGAGWALVLVDGISIGFAKQAGGRLNNHYPRGLRI